MTRTEALRQYRDRRDFRRTPEPRGAACSRWKTADHPVFVIQQHAAHTVHFDWRLEIGGVLVSWAVPKGPSTDPRDKRLAIRTEDHPLDYADFEGVIPAGEYGAGSVIVWDAGPFEFLRRGDDAAGDAAAALAAGRLAVWLEGRKLRGGYTLVQARLGGHDDHWLLLKANDEGADARRRPTSTEPASVLSGRTLAELDAADTNA